MNIKQKMIEAMSWCVCNEGDDYEGILNAALSVAADPENWDDGMRKACSMNFGDQFRDGINHIKGLPS